MAEAISTTFKRRHTDVPARSAALETAFATHPGKAEQWRSYLRRNRIEGPPRELADVTAYIGMFLLSVATALSKGTTPFERQWNAPGPWR